MDENSVDDGSVKRRTFLHGVVNGLIGVWGVVAAGGIGFTGFKYLWPSRDMGASGGDAKIDIPIADIPGGELVKLKFKGVPIGLIERNGTYHALSIVCTHLGCIVTLDPNGSDNLYCPCHASVFDINGNVLDGPAPKPLQTYPVQVINDRVVIG